MSTSNSPVRVIGIEAVASISADLRSDLVEQLEASGTDAEVELHFGPIEGDASVGLWVRPTHGEAFSPEAVSTIDELVRSRLGTFAVPIRPQLGLDHEDHPVQTQARTWCLDLMGVTAAHAAGLTGRGIRIGHADTGYTLHDELREPQEPSRLLAHLGRDLVDDDGDPIDPLESGVGLFPGHGTGTSSVIMSGLGGAMVGVAPGAELVPYRVTNTVVLWTRRLRRNLARAIDLAVDNECRVISISLGHFWAGRELRDAVQRAVDAGVLVIAAAGQLGDDTPGLRVVAAPARLPGTIAVASCDHLRRPSSWSSRGHQIDVTAPGDHVWRAEASTGGGSAVSRSYGTSYSTAHVAGVAALWLEKWKDHPSMKATEGRSLRLGLFRWALAECGLTAPVGVEGSGAWGRGVIDAGALLDLEPLPVGDVGSIAPALVSLDDVAELAELVGEVHGMTLEPGVARSATIAALTDVFAVDGAEVAPLLGASIDPLVAHLDANPLALRDFGRVVRGHAELHTEPGAIARLQPELAPELFSDAPLAIRERLRGMA